MIQQVRARKRLKQAAGQADPARAARMVAHAGAQLASMPQASAANAVLSARFLAAAVGDPAAGLTDEQVNMVVHLAVELVRGTPQAITAVEMTSAVLTNRYPDVPPPGCLAVADLDAVSWRDLAARRTWLLAAIAAARPGTEPRGVRAEALALAAVLAELDTRAKCYRTGIRRMGRAGIRGRITRCRARMDRQRRPPRTPPTQAPGGRGNTTRPDVP